jgi:hypothetical protein
VNTSGSVIKGPPSSGQHFKTGISARDGFSLNINSLHGPDLTVFGMKEDIAASFGSAFSLSMNVAGISAG